MKLKVIQFFVCVCVCICIHKKLKTFCMIVVIDINHSLQIYYPIPNQHLLLIQTCPLFKSHLFQEVLLII